MVRRIEYKSRDGLATGLAALVAGQLIGILAEKDCATLALPGGATPGPFLRALSGAKLDWSRVTVLMTDERFVPETSSRSDAGMLRATFLKGPAAAANLVPLYQPADSPEDVVNALACAIQKVLPLDICVLGMGTDKHVASLFPGADNLTKALDPQGGQVLMAMRAPNASEPRLTLTAPVLCATPKIHLLITGSEKNNALAQADHPGPAAEAPVRAILSAPGEVTVHYAD